MITIILRKIYNLVNLILLNILHWTSKYTIFYFSDYNELSNKPQELKQFLTALLIYDSHVIRFTHLKCMIKVYNLKCI